NSNRKVARPWISASKNVPPSSAPRRADWARPVPPLLPARAFGSSSMAATSERWTRRHFGLKEPPANVRLLSRRISPRKKGGNGFYLHALTPICLSTTTQGQRRESLRIGTTQHGSQRLIATCWRRSF